MKTLDLTIPYISNHQFLSSRTLLLKKNNAGINYNTTVLPRTRNTKPSYERDVRWDQLFLCEVQVIHSLCHEVWDPKLSAWSEVPSYGDPLSLNLFITSFSGVLSLIYFLHSLIKSHLQTNNINTRIHCNNISATKIAQTLITFQIFLKIYLIV